ncbi:4-hydroxythreonine-4-phosphate dehydrogenase PdxA [bacterium endosymbiont of Bathymodiolus sp. 5 South]|jgi:4-hydroxythreonine-4-phosphate dehydrogenase|uniref:4-hydroxythreonine-4-phosphate dehydrogenase PdxA n=1 Tax=bacterium endosymbiont of Bathymodiolus sp. 5 South TaxID=1181670 RepID=UPI0010B3ED5D|nr:4-hydroxythreonine-4-phosphate dehydrogenase PdxA [bacterium endosymbiont of Bathymodiolus sp. 5 South]CAC9641825.1 4-hydroxythreonine-4-phosphate dehydrogenase (EC 1.1.1.262) [uncultured Gammaproteobacteria bacterium]CAC9644813.1 4-hydroxythreonine-4-phosphate dehydrogenase (EC 1.1.1.262) [uncultured Gammaproteobacteria bacterium]SHN90013.1 4-hydroxythreonine-4-phosphate dehydrogenase [bacterium endosymbiont of Bathymodiolus sp. 5 South]SSC08440.1 4-hydroxythreonine-4-phosphate dehydrogenas
MFAFTPGEPAGIGPDLAVIYAQEKSKKDLLIFADPDMLLDRAKTLNLTLKISESESTSNAQTLCIYPVKTAAKVIAGTLNKNNAEYVLKTLDLATQHCLNDNTQALVTGPLHKGIINQAGIYPNFSGHTEYLAHLSGVDKTVMMLATDGFRVALATTHIPLNQVSKNIQADALEKTLNIIHKSLQNYGLHNPKIVVCGLNPHAGEDGYLGSEEIEIINPLIEKLNTQGLNLVGSVPADTAFTPDALKGVDCVLAMYHDQGLPVLKTLGFKKAVNITLGLPFIRTSVDHGTALSLAGTGNISLGSFNTALKTAQNFIASKR